MPLTAKATKVALETNFDVKSRKRKAKETDVEEIATYKKRKTNRATRTRQLREKTPEEHNRLEKTVETLKQYQSKGVQTKQYQSRGVQTDTFHERVLSIFSKPLFELTFFVDLTLSPDVSLA